MGIVGDKAGAVRDRAGNDQTVQRARGQGCVTAWGEKTVGGKTTADYAKDCSIAPLTWMRKVLAA